MEVNESDGAGFAGAEVVEAADTVVGAKRLFDQLNVFGRESGIQEGGEGGLGDVEGGVKDEEADGDGDDLIHDVPAGEGDQSEAHEDADGGVDIDLKVVSIRLEGDGTVLFGDLSQVAGNEDVDDGRDRHDGDSEGDRFRLASVDDAENRFIDDPGAGEKDEERLDSSGDRFDLSVAVGMALVGGGVGDTYGVPGDEGGDKIDARMNRLGKDGDGVDLQADAQFHHGQPQVRNNREPGGIGLCVDGHDEWAIVAERCCKCLKSKAGFEPGERCRTGGREDEPGVRFGALGTRQRALGIKYWYHRRGILGTG